MKKACSNMFGKTSSIALKTLKIIYEAMENT